MQMQKSYLHLKVMGMPGSVDGPSEPPMAPGGYMDSHTTIKVRLEVAVPLTTPQQVADKPYIHTTEQVGLSQLGSGQSYYIRVWDGGLVMDIRCYKLSQFTSRTPYQFVVF